MNRLITRAGAMLAVALTVATVAADAQAHAKAEKFASHCAGKLVSATKLTGRCSSTLGDYSFVTVASGANYTEVDTYSHGTVHVRGTRRLTSKGTAANDWTFTGGSGSFKGISGHGTGVTNVSTLHITLTGTVTR